MISIYTPTHNPKWLGECYNSLLRQREKIDWEWVILLNNTVDAVPPEILADERIKVKQSVERNSNVGYLKGLAVQYCTKQLLLELDHDDTLSPFCFGEVLEAHRKKPNGFYWSDFASVFPNGSCETFSSTFGWEQYQDTEGYCVDPSGEGYMCQRSFPAVPRALAEIWYAPNHVRVWSRSAYEAAGGYDATLTVGDDHDLICRTYLAGVPFVHIPKPLYMYRRVLEPGTDNSYVTRQGDVVKMNQKNMNKYLHQLVFEWCRREGKPVLELSPSKYDFPRGIRVDRDFEQAEYGCIRAVDFLQNVADPVRFMNQCYHHLADGGFLLTGTPSTDGRAAFMNPEVKSFWNQNSFWYYVDRQYSRRMVYLPVLARFQDVRLWTEFPTEFHQRNNMPYVYADLCAVKGHAHIGPVRI